MEKKAECEIVQDLLLGYVDDTLNPESKKIVEKHLIECERCIGRLQAIKRDIKKDENAQQKEIDYLKKINRSKNISKIIIAILSLFLIIMSVTVLPSYIQEIKNYRKNKVVSDILFSAYWKLEEIENENNYSVVATNHVLGYKNGFEAWYETIILHKDGYVKEEVQDEYNYVPNYVTYGKTKDYKTYCIQFSDKSDYTAGWGNTKDWNILYNYSKRNLLEYRNFEVRNENLEGIQYYVVRENFNNGRYTDIWINKDTMILLKIQHINTDQIDETTYKFSINNVKDEDIRLTNINGYNIDEETLKMIKDFEILK